MGGIILFVLLILLVVILVTPAIRSRLNRDVPAPTQESPHEVVVRRLDDARARRNRPKDDSIPGEKD